METSRISPAGAGTQVLTFYPNGIQRRLTDVHGHVVAVCWLDPGHGDIDIQLLETTVLYSRSRHCSAMEVTPMSPELIGILGLAGISVTLGLFMMKRIDRVGDRVTRLEVAFTDRMARLEGLFEGYTRQTKS